MAPIIISTSFAIAQPPLPSPNWSQAMAPGPDTTVKITAAYAAHEARDAFFWAWPLVNIYNKRRGAEQSKELAYAGPVPAAPLNRIVMLTDYLAPDERIVACPNQDVAYGGWAGEFVLRQMQDHRLAHLGLSEARWLLRQNLEQSLLHRFVPDRVDLVRR
jgi:hypothetical protein